MKSADVKNKDTKTLTGMLAEKREALRNFRFGTAGSKSRNVKEARMTKRDIARIMTEIRRAELATVASAK